MIARRGRALAIILVAVAFTTGCAKLFRDAPRPTVGVDQATRLLPELWRDRGDIASLDLYHGPGGRELQPPSGRTWKFRKQDSKGFSPGWDVVDSAGREWSVKQGPEAQSEVVASRILWVLGYHQPPTYYVADWSLADGPEPGKQTPGRFRPSLPGARRAGEWSWEKNPFAGTQPFRGLLVLQRILNNWDLLDRNNTIYEFKEPVDGVRRWYVVKDLGAALGKTSSGGPLSGRQGSKNDIDGFEKQDFIRAVKGDRVEFDDTGFRNRHLYRDVKVADVRWICERLNRLTPAQWKDAFRAANYPDDVSDRFIRKIKEKVAYGLSLPAGS